MSDATIPPPRSASSGRMMWLSLAILAVIFTAFYVSARNRAGRLTAPSLHKPRGQYTADFGWPLASAADGSVLSLEKFRGKTIFLNIWATWCPPCVAELPAIERLAANPKLKDVAFLAVSNEDLETIQHFTRQRGYKIPFYRADPDGMPQIFQTDAIPATFIIAPDGRIATAQLGSAEWDDPSVVDYLIKLTSESPGAASGS